MTSDVSSILLVDDNKDICANMADILTDLGYNVDVAHEGATALGLAQTRPYDVALLDLKMPGMDGLTLYREIKKVQAGTVAMLITAYSSQSTVDDAVAAGVWQVVPKPIDCAQIVGLIEGALACPLVLVVDDDADLCANLWDLLRGEGYRLCIAHDGQQAARKLRGSTRVVLVDMKLPDRSGVEIFRQVREVHPEARTVLITGYRAEMEPMAERLKAEGADAILYKPFNVPELLGTVAQLAER